MTDKSRAAFEATIKRNQPCFSTRRMPEGEYQSGTTENLWLMWQESRKQATEAAADECEAMVMYPRGRCEAPKHDSVWHAAKAIRGLI